MSLPFLLPGNVINEELADTVDKITLDHNKDSKLFAVSLSRTYAAFEEGQTLI